MMKLPTSCNQLKIYIDRLRDGNELSIEESVPSELLDLQDGDLEFAREVKISGEAYTTDDHLIIRLEIETCAYLPCTICNEKVEIPINIHDFAQTLELTEIRKAIYDFSKDVRDAILLKTPRFAECEGNCPERAALAQFLKN